MRFAIEDKNQYVLTELGKQLVHYSMTEMMPKIASGETPAGGA